jgi:hypothetical protein
MNDTTEAPVAEKKPEVVRDIKNDVTRPDGDGPTAKVWKTADDLTAKLGRIATRAEVLEAGLATGVNKSTISTQYARWRKYNGITGRLPKAEKPEGTTGETATTAAA